MTLVSPTERVLIAPDKFKGSLSAAAGHQAWWPCSLARAGFAGEAVRLLPVADLEEGSTGRSTRLSAAGYRRIELWGVRE